MAPDLARTRRSPRGLLPLALSLGLVLIGSAPLGIPHLPALAPIAAIVAVYYWSVWRPDLLPAAACFGIGVLHDLLSGGPIGVTALALVLLHGLCVSQRQMLVGLPFAAGWLAFALFAAGAVGLIWLLLCLFHLAPIDPRPASLQFGLTVAVYPVLVWLFGRTEMHLLRRA